MDFNPFKEKGNGVGVGGWGGGRGILPDPFRTSRLSWSLSTLLSPRDVYLPEVGKDHWDGVIVEDDLTRDGCVVCDCRAGQSDV